MRRRHPFVQRPLCREPPEGHPAMQGRGQAGRRGEEQKARGAPGGTRAPRCTPGASLPRRRPLALHVPAEGGKGLRAASSRDGALGPAPAPPPRAHKGPPRPLPDPPRAVPTRPRGPRGGFGGTGRDGARAGARGGRRGSVPAGGRAGPAGSSLWAPGGGAVRGWRSGGGCWKPGAGGCGGGRVRSAGPAPFGEPPPSGPPPPRPRPRLRPRPAPGARSNPSDMLPLPLRSGRGGAALGHAGRRPASLGAHGTAGAARPRASERRQLLHRRRARPPRPQLPRRSPCGPLPPPRGAPGGSQRPPAARRPRRARARLARGQPRPSRPGASGPAVRAATAAGPAPGPALTRRPGPRRAARGEAGSRRLTPRK